MVIFCPALAVCEDQCVETLSDLRQRRPTKLPGIISEKIEDAFAAEGDGPTGRGRRATGTLAVGSTLGEDGRYEILGAIGNGAMGVVHKAQDKKLGRKVAVKTVLAKPDERGRANLRVEREMQTLAKISNRHVMQIFDIITQSGASSIMICEYLDGQSLQNMIDHRSEVLNCSDSLNTTIDIGVDILSALKAVHSAGYVHRDVKPANIMFCRDPQMSSGKEFQSKLVDFGIAVESGARATKSKGGLTTTGGISGTPGFMGPLAASGSADPRIDLWALAVTVFVCATSDMPFATGRGGLDPFPADKLHAKHPAADKFADALEEALRKDWDHGFMDAEGFKAALETSRQPGLTTRLRVMDAKLGTIAEGIESILESVEELKHSVLEVLTTTLAIARDELEYPSTFIVIPILPKTGVAVSSWRNWLKSPSRWCCNK